MPTSPVKPSNTKMKLDNVFKLLTKLSVLPVNTEISVGDTEEYLFIEKSVAKAMQRRVVVKQGGAGGTYLNPFCPECGENVQSANDFSFRFCPHCGQKLDWNYKE